MIIKKLHTLILKSFFVLLLPSLFITIFVLILQFIWLYADDLIGKGLQFKVFFELLYYLSLMNLTMALPIAVMLASIMTFGNMGEHFELTAAKSAGISLYKIMSPVFTMAVIFTIFSFFFANNIFPYATLKAYSLIASIRQQHPSLRIQEGIFNYDVEGYVIRVGAKSKSSQMMYDFLIYDHLNYVGNRFVLTADSGTVKVTDNLKFMIINLYNGQQYEELNEDVTDPDDFKYPYHVDKFNQQVVIIPLKGFDYKETDMSLYSQHYNILNMRQLNIKIDSLKLAYEDKIDYYQKIILNNDILKSQIKFRTSTDSVTYFDKLEVLNNIPPNELKIIYDTDSAFSSLPLQGQKEILKLSVTNAENLYNRMNVFYQEFESRREWLAEHQIAKHKKYVFAFACFIFFFIGAPLGTIIRKGGFGLPTIISVLLILTFYVILTLGEKFARDGVMTPFNGIWLAVYIFLPFEFYLFYKASRDSVVLNYDYYLEFFQKIFRTITPNFLRRQQYKKLRKKLQKKV
ncbi:MAG: LptF/LptG family permease [Bacteroidales bacterium]|nr:LptF/LptG family permease [Bacteroidales bacterium]